MTKLAAFIPAFLFSTVALAREIRVRLSGEIQKAMQAPELKERFISLGLDAVSNTPDEMAAFMSRQQERYGSIIKSQNIRIEQ